MATTQLNTKIKLRYDTLENWQKTDVAGKGGNLILLQGEVAFCEVPNTGISGGKTVNDTGTHDYRPTVLFKVGAKDKNGNLQAFKDLPWGSALAADVYSWAKEANKPTYNASEIALTDSAGNTQQNNVEDAIAEIYGAISNLTGGAGTISQQIAALTPDDPNAPGTSGVQAGANNYITGLKVDGNGHLVLQTASLENYIKAITGTPDSDKTIQDEIDGLEDVISGLEVNDIQATTNPTAMSSGDTVVVSVTQKDGKIAVTKQSLGLGTAARKDVTATNHIITDADAAVATKENGLVSAAQVAEYVINRTAALTGATHFKGALVPGENETAADVLADISNPVVGDIYLVGTAEYIYNDDADNDGANAEWVLLGDEGIYATKAYVDNELDGKVDKNGTDRLITATEAAKLATIEEGAEVNDVTDITVGGTSVIDGTTKVAALGAMAGKSEVAYSDLESTLAADLDGKLDGVSASIATVTNDIVTIKGGLEVDNTTTAGTNTVVNTANTNDITLAKVAKTGLITDLDLGDGLILDGGNAEIPAQEP